MGAKSRKAGEFGGREVERGSWYRLEGGLQAAADPFSCFSSSKPYYLSNSSYWRQIEEQNWEDWCEEVEKKTSPKWYKIVAERVGHRDYEFVGRPYGSEVRFQLWSSSPDKKRCGMVKGIDVCWLMEGKWKMLTFHIKV